VAKKNKKRKYTPQRTCVGCRGVEAKQTLIRVVKTPEDGVQLDETGKLHGRGAYLHEKRSCWASGLRGRLARALRTELTDEDRLRLNAFMEGLPET
jgi:predicted RNA-binding protein YlxR (DUF448 family)